MSSDARLGPRLTLLYDRDCAFCTWTARRLRAFDRRHRIGLVPLQEARTGGARPDLAWIAPPDELTARIHGVTSSGDIVTGGKAMLDALAMMPGGRLLRPWSWLAERSGVAERGYDAIERRRDRLARMVGARSADDPLCPLPPLDPAPRSRHEAATRSPAPNSRLRATLADTERPIPAGGRDA